MYDAVCIRDNSSRWKKEPLICSNDICSKNEMVNTDWYTDILVQPTVLDCERPSDSINIVLKWSAENLKRNLFKHVEAQSYFGFFVYIQIILFSWVATVEKVFGQTTRI